jgi:hypothetical protein
VLSQTVKGLVGKNRQTFSFAFRTLKTEYQRAKSVKEKHL